MKEQTVAEQRLTPCGKGSIAIQHPEAQAVVVPVRDTLRGQNDARTSETEADN